MVRQWNSTGSKNTKRPEKYMPEHHWYNQAENVPNPINPQSFWASTEWLTCTDSCLHMIYGSGVLPQKRSLLLDSASHTDKASTPSWLSRNWILQKPQETLNRTTHCPVTFVDRKIRHVMFIRLGYTQTNAPALRTSSPLYLPAPTYIGDEENSVPALFQMSAWICVPVWSLSNLAWQGDWN